MGTFVVEYISSGGVFTDISNFVQELGKTHFYSDGRISISSLTLQADFGQFITDSRGGTTPIISQYDRIRITYTAFDGQSYRHIFEVIDDLGQLTKQAKYLLPLTLEGRERSLSLIPFSGYFDPPIGHKDISQKILSVYGFSKNITTQPTLIDVVNELPDFNPNFWDFQYIDNCLDALIQVVKVANLSVAAGGAGDRFAITYEDVDGDLNIMRINIISQGTSNSGDPFVTITGDPIYNPIQVIDKIKQPFTGTVMVARGRPGTGGTPRQGDIYRSRLEFYERTPFYNNSTAYKDGVYVTFGNQITNPEIPMGQVYQAIQDTTGNLPTNPTFWILVSAFDYIGDIQYSPFTIDKASLYKNECTNAAAGFASDSEASPKMLDCNIVINDVETQRDWVYIRTNTDVVASLSVGQKAYLFQQTDYYPGFRILVDVAGLGTGAGSFDPTLDAFSTGAGNDPNGRPYANNAVIRIEDKWVVIKEHEDFDQIVVRHEGLYEWNVSFGAGSRFPASDNSNANRRLRQAGTGTPNGWKSLNGQFLANDCLHSPSSITNITGLQTPIATDTGFYTDDSAVRIIYEYGVTDKIEEYRMILDEIIGFIPGAADFLATFANSAQASVFNLFLTPQYRNAGWWITFTAPWPFNNLNVIEEEVGELYGGQTLLELENHAFFDAYNQRVAYSGRAGFNEPDSADLMEITGVTFLYRLDIQTNDVTIPFTGDIPCSYWVIDDNGTIWKSKDKYRFLGDVQRFTFNFGDFTPVYRARSPFGISNIVTNILVPELEIRERLFPSRIKIQGFMLEGGYDDKGRYLPNLWDGIIKPTIFNLFSVLLNGLNVKFIGDFDAFQWVKTPIAIENGSNLGITPDRVIFPEFRDYPNITNIEQLQRAASADFSIEFFQYEQYTLVQNDRADVILQDTVYMREEFLIPESDQTLAKTNAWITATNYVPNDIVNDAGTIYESLTEHTSGVGNKPPSSDWQSLGAVSVPNTREVIVGEIALSVTNGRDWQRDMTILRRIPKVTT